MPENHLVCAFEGYQPHPTLRRTEPGHTLTMYKGMGSWGNGHPGANPAYVIVDNGRVASWGN